MLDLENLFFLAFALSLFRYRPLDERRYSLMKRA